MIAQATDTPTPATASTVMLPSGAAVVIQNQFTFGELLIAALVLGLILLTAFAFVGEHVRREWTR